MKKLALMAGSATRLKLADSRSAVSRDRDRSTVPARSLDQRSCNAASERATAGTVSVTTICIRKTAWRAATQSGH